MTKKQLSNIESQAKNACKYEDYEGFFLQMHYVDETGFGCINIDTGEDIFIEFTEVTGKFWKLVPMGDY
jgi:hypothetical protein